LRAGREILGGEGGEGLIRPRFKRRASSRRALGRFFRLHPRMWPRELIDRALWRAWLRERFKLEQEILFGTGSGKRTMGVIHAKEATR
jgi:hypothetical protein